jgi:hypothetical protein
MSHELAGDIAALKAGKPRTFDQWLALAPDDKRTQVLAAIEDESIPANPLARLLSQKHGIPITRETIVSRRESL